MLVFIAIALTIYGLVNLYVARRGGQALASVPLARTIFLILYIVLAASYPAGRILRTQAENGFTVWLDNVGAFHMVIMFYGLLGVILVDIVRLANSFVPFLPRTVTGHPGRTGIALFVVIAAGTALTVIWGAWNAARPHLVDLEVHLPRRAGAVERMTAVHVSDIHLGTLLGSARLRKVVEKINGLGPDVVFMTGDIVDESISARQRERLSAVMGTLRTGHGPYVVPGNHETYAGLDRILPCYRSCGLTVLQDQAIRVADAFTLIGRRDPSSLKKGEGRLGIRDILERERFDDSLPLIVLDHQPAHLAEAEAAGVSLQLSGHTHAGQIFPLDLVNRLAWELNWGYLKKGETQYYVTSGVGTWGPPVRTGSWPEIVRLTLIFDRTP
jgi:uncharacterized protein